MSETYIGNVSYIFDMMNLKGFATLSATVTSAIFRRNVNMRKLYNDRTASWRTKYDKICSAVLTEHTSM